jgi:dTDP-glucose 4,6-dehydratase
MQRTKKQKNKWGKVILVTGGMGFIGSNYLNTCVPRYPQYLFINLDALTYAANKRNVSVSKSPNYLFVKGDIRNARKLERIFKKYQPTDIINFAAESHVDLSIKNPHIFVETNVLGTHNLLHLAKKHALRRFYQISTDEVYGSLGKTDASFTETTTLAPNSPYSASKAAADLLVRSYGKTFGLDVVVSRCSNNYGPNQDTTKLIPRFISLLLQDKKVPLYSKGENIRDWLYVGDHVEAIDLIFHKGKSGEVYNIGGSEGSEKTNMEITETLLKLLKKDKAYIEFVADRPGHDFRYSIDSSKLRGELGWVAQTSFEEGIKKTIEHYQGLANRKK